MYIGYVAVLSFGRLRLRYAAMLESDAVGASPAAVLQQRQSLRGGLVSATPGDVSWRVPVLDVVGEWSGGTGTAPVVVAETEAGAIEWQCLSLDAAASVTCDGRRYAGPGYAEVVRLSLPPWRLPLSDLRWGRFVADDRSAALTWIAAGGASTFEGAWTPDGRLDARVGEASVEACGPDGDVRLTWDTGRPIRGERVSRSLLGRLAVFERLLPRGVRGIAEEKRLSRGVLVDAAGCHGGWVVHERVRWT